MRPLLSLVLIAQASFAAAFTSKATGNWSASGQTTWNQSGVPGSGDTVTSTHAITVDVDTTIGTSGVNGTAAVTTSGTGTVTVAAGKLFRVRGDFVVPSLQLSLQATLVLSAGAIFEWDSSLASSPATTKYNMRTAGASYGGANYLRANGSSGSHCTVRSNSGGGNGYFNTATDTGGGIVLATYTDFLRIGDASQAGFSPDFPAGNNPPDGFWDVQHCTFTSCGTINVGPSSATPGLTVFRHKYNQHISTVATSVMGMNTASAITTGERSIIGNVFDKSLGVPGSGSVVRDFTLTDNLFEQGFDIATSQTWASFTRNLQRQVSGSGTTIPSSVTDSYTVYDTYSDLSDHIDVTASLDLLRNVYDATYLVINTSDISDGLLVPSGNAGTYNVKYNIVLPAGDGRGGTALVAPRQDSTAVMNLEHNTAIPGTKVIEIVQVGASTNHGTIKNNMFWDTSVRGTILDADGSATPTTDFYTVANIANNGQNNIKQTASPGTGYTNQANGYASAFSSTPGASDIKADPQFLDKTRNFATFDTAYLRNVAGSTWTSHSSGDTFAVGDIVSDHSSSYFSDVVINYRCIASHVKSASNSQPGVGSAWHTYWEFATLNSIRNAVFTQTTITDPFIGVSSATYITSVKAWVSTGFRPTNMASFNGAGSDGITPGAMPMYSSTAAAGLRGKTGLRGAATVR